MSFDLQKALDRQTRGERYGCQTKGGKRVSILCTDAAGQYPVVGLILVYGSQVGIVGGIGGKGSYAEIPRRWTKEGTFEHVPIGRHGTGNDLVNISEPIKPQPGELWENGEGIRHLAYRTLMDTVFLVFSMNKTLACVGDGPIEHLKDGWKRLYPPVTE